MKTLSFWKKSIYSGLMFFGTLIVLSVGYSAWNATMSKVNPGNPLSATAWNALVDNIADLDSRWVRNGATIAYTGGNVGIGTASPSYKLDNYWTFASANAYFYNHVTRGGDNNTTVALDRWGTNNIETLTFRTSNVDKWYVGMWNNATDNLDIWANWGMRNLTISNANVLIGTTADAGYKLDVNGTIRGTSWTNSDRNLKKNIETLTGGLDKVGSIRWVTYNWKDPSKWTGLQVGVIAQEVERVLPELVSTDKQGVKAVNYAGLVAPLIEAVKAQQKEIQAQQDQINTLQAEIQALKNER